jgi:hypothetical protein
MRKCWREKSACVIRNLHSYGMDFPAANPNDMSRDTIRPIASEHSTLTTPPSRNKMQSDRYCEPLQMTGPTTKVRPKKSNVTIFFQSRINDI